MTRVRITVSGVVFMAGLACAAGDGNAPMFRGPDGTGFYRGAAPVSWNESGKTGILWKAKLDRPGWSSPIVWGDHVVVTAADTEKRWVACFAAATGKGVWKTDVSALAGAGPSHALETMSSHWDTLLQAGATPATNGKQVFALFSNGQLTALDLATGTSLWSVGLGDSSGNKYGLDNSLLVNGTSVIAVFEANDRYVAAYDAATGKQQWKTPRVGSTWASPILAKTPSGRVLVVLPADPDVSAWDAKTGVLVWSTKVLQESPPYCVGPSPVTDGKFVFASCENAGIFALDLEKGTPVWSLKDLPDGSPSSSYSSMTTDGPRLYHVSQSVLTVIEARSGKVLAQKTLDQNASEASPVVVGDKLYLACSSSVMVYSVGPNPEKVGEGGMNDTVESTPAFAGGRLFIRTGDALYGIGY